MGKPVRRTGHLSPLRIAQAKRRSSVRQDFLNRLTNQIALANRHGVSQPTIHSDIKSILRQMKEEDDERALEERTITLARIEDNIREATIGWEASKQSRQEIRTEYQKRNCKDCKGTGMSGGNEDSDKWCDTCNGDGTYTEEVVTTKVVGQAGDSNFLKERRENNRFRAQILGLFPEKEKRKNGDSRDIHFHDHVVNVDNVDPEEVLEAMIALAKVRKSIVNSKVIDIKMIEGDDNS